MPTYEYECLNCGHHFERFQMMSDKPIKTCPKCHKSVRRLIGTGSGIIFKGAGFYATDYRKPDTSQPTEGSKAKEVPQQEKKPQDKKPQDKKPQDNKPQDKRPYKKEIPGPNNTKAQ